MNSVTSWNRSGLYVATDHSMSLIAPSHSTRAGSPYRSRKTSENAEDVEKLLGAVQHDLRVLGEQLGLITRPKGCSWCRRRLRLERHHWDYDEPLNVIYLCIDCHAIADSMAWEAGIA